MMSPKNKKSSTQNVPVDILSNLPGDAIDAILLRLPLHDAVRTSILSKKWRYKWCTLPELTLYLGDFGMMSDSIPLTYKFANIIYHLLTLHAGPITKFTFHNPYFGRGLNIDNLIYFLSRNGIQHLDLRFPQIDRYKLPSSIFTCLHMRHLTLESCSVQLPPPVFLGFDWLTSLELRFVTISSKCLESFISRCPLLEHLVLRYLNFSGVIEINAPRLRYADIIGIVSSFCIKNSPLLEKLILKGGYLSKVERKCDIVKFLESFSSLKLLHLDHDGLKHLTAGMSEVPTRLPFDLNCVERIYLDIIYLDELDVVSWALCLIRSSPYLQYIEIEVKFGEDGVNIPALESLEVEAFSDVTFSHLKEVKLIIYVGSEPEMQLMKLMLAKSPMLVRMQIELRLEDEEHDSLCKAIKISAALNSFWRASSIAKVVYDVTCRGSRLIVP